MKFCQFADIKNLIEEAKKSELKRARICFHRDQNDIVQEMLIVLDKHCFIKPHKHIGKTESALCLHGEADLVFFDDEGGVKKIIQISSFNNNNSFYVRIEDPIFHTIIVKSDYFIFFETTMGPFLKENTVYASWAPSNLDELKNLVKYT